MNIRIILLGLFGVLLQSIAVLSAMEPQRPPGLEQDGFYAQRNDSHGFYHLKIPLRNEHECFSFGNHKISCGYMAAYAAWAMSFILERYPRASHCEIYGAMLKLRPAPFLEDAATIVQQEFSKAPGSCTSCIFGSEHILEKPISDIKVRCILRRLCKCRSYNMVFCFGNLSFGTHDVRVRMMTGHSPQAYTFYWQSFSKIIASFINDVECGKKKYAVIITVDTLPRGDHWITVVVRKNIKNELEYLIFDGLDGKKNGGINYCDIENATEPLLSTRWIYLSHLKYA